MCHSTIKSVFSSRSDNRSNCRPKPTARQIHALVLDNGTRFELANDKYSIGRQTTCDIVIADHNVSRVHAEIKDRSRNVAN